MKCQCNKCLAKRSPITEDNSRPSMGMVSLSEGIKLDRYNDFRNGDITLQDLERLNHNDGQWGQRS